MTAIVTAMWINTALRWTVNVVLVVVLVLCALSLVYLVAVVAARTFQRLFRR